VSGPLLILQTGNVPRRFGLRDGFGEMFARRAGLAPDDFRILDAARGPGYPRDPRAHCAYIVTGSLSMVTARPLWSLRLADFILRAVESGVPVLGVCYGHQLVARALGGRVGWNPNGLEMGTHEVTLAPGAEGHPLLRGLPPSFPANLSHRQSILDPPPGGRPLAFSAADPCQILAVGEKVLTLQFHPEFDRWIASAFAREHFTTKDGRTVPLLRRPPRGAPAGLSLGVPVRNTPVAALILRRFVEGALPRHRARLAPAGFGDVQAPGNA
jgi:GMP synthase (glutamine-hydrolysing)